MTPRVHADVTARRTPRLEALGNTLVATEFTDAGRLALERAARLPIGIGALIELAHVSHAAEPEADIRERLNEERSRLFGRHPNRTVTSVLEGEPSSALARRARHTRAELVVAGRHGPRTWRESLRGTTADRIVRAGASSTLIVSLPATGPYRCPLVAVDFSPSSLPALELGARICGPEIPMHVLHVATVEEAQHESAVALTLLPERRRELARAIGLARLERFLEETALPVSWRPAVQVGEPSDWILEAARQRDTDLIIIGAVGKGLIRRALLGSVAERVMHEASCDVLVARLPEVHE